MNKLLLLILISNFWLMGFTQDETDSTTIKSIFCGDEAELIFINPDIKPIYKGGDQKLINVIKSNLNYPSQACIEGRVYASFIIDTLGQVTDVRIARGINKELDKEAIRVVKLLGNWTPGTQNGRKIRVKYTIPVNFKIERE